MITFILLLIQLSFYKKTIWLTFFNDNPPLRLKAMTIYFHYIFGENAIKGSGSLYGEFRVELKEF